MATPEHVRTVLENPQTIELLAAIEHERWARWQRYVHDRCERREDGSILIPPDLVARWETQIETPYLQLSEHEKDSDREQVHSYLPTIIDALTPH
jgi:hypothetical protein